MIYSIIGAGGFAQEVFYSLPQKKRKNLVFFVEDEWFKSDHSNILPLSKFNPKLYKTIVAIGDPIVRKRIVENLPKETVFFTHIDKSVRFLSDSIRIDEGSIVCAGTILTTNIRLGKHTQLNLHTTIGHDTIIGDYFTTAPGCKVSGNCKIDDLVYLGTNSSVKQKINICSKVTVGMNSAVVKDITESGVYVGIPSKKLEKNE